MHLTIATVIEYVSEYSETALCIVGLWTYNIILSFHNKIMIWKGFWDLQNLNLE